jgi:UDP-galactopyranose mutase
MINIDALVVGAGFSGSVVAERLAAHGFSVLVIDKRPHIGGNAYDTLDDHGVMIHPYGPHIFHTNGTRIAQYLSNFTRWRRYEHRVLAKVGDQFVPLPINIDTVNRLYGLELDESTIQAFYDSVREPRDQIRTSEDVVINAVGRDLYEKFFRGYTIKQWGLDPAQLSSAVAARIPTRTCRDDRYFTDTFQSMPLDGYTALFQRMLAHPRIDVEVGLDFFRFRQKVRARHIIYTARYVLRLLLRAVAIPLAALRARAPGELRQVPARRHRQFSERLRLYPDQRVQAPDRSAALGHFDRARVSNGRRRSLLPDPASGERRAVQTL